MKEEAGFVWTEETRRKKPKQRLVGGRNLGVGSWGGMIVQESMVG